MNNLIISFIITFIAGFSTLIGGFIPFLNVKNKDMIILVSLTLAAGIMFAISIFDLLPEAFYYLYGHYSSFIIILIIFLSLGSGVAVFIILDRFLSKDIDNLYKAGLFSMIAVIIHNIPEGIITFILSNDDIRIGMFMGLSIALHNIPEGISIMVPVYYGTGNFKKAFFYTLLAGLAEPIGGVIFYLLFRKYITNLMMGVLFSFITGIMIYLSFAELLPKALKYNKIYITIFTLMIGIILFLIISIFMH